MPAVVRWGRPARSAQGETGIVQPGKADWSEVEAMPTLCPRSSKWRKIYSPYLKVLSASH